MLFILASGPNQIGEEDDYILQLVILTDPGWGVSIFPQIAPIKLAICHNWQTFDLIRRKTNVSKKIVKRKTKNFHQLSLLLLFSSSQVNSTKQNVQRTYLHCYQTRRCPKRFNLLNLISFRKQRFQISWYQISYPN